LNDRTYEYESVTKSDVEGEVGGNDLFTMGPISGFDQRFVGKPSKSRKAGDAYHQFY